MVAINTGALAMALFGFVLLFGGLGVSLYYALQAGGYEDEDEADVA